jgi:hypothetical protein
VKQARQFFEGIEDDGTRVLEARVDLDEAVGDNSRHAVPAGSRFHLVDCKRSVTALDQHQCVGCQPHDFLETHARPSLRDLARDADRPRSLDGLGDERVLTDGHHRIRPDHDEHAWLRQSADATRDCLTSRT